MSEEVVEQDYKRSSKSWRGKNYRKKRIYLKIHNMGDSGASGLFQVVKHVKIGKIQQVTSTNTDDSNKTEQDASGTDTVY